jgi:hypothetical protein
MQTSFGLRQPGRIAEFRAFYRARRTFRRNASARHPVVWLWPDRNIACRSNEFGSCC